MKNNFVSVIEDAGLSPLEAKLYGGLLEIKEGTMTDLAKQAGIKRSSGYNTIGRLETLGLISKIIRGKRTYYSAIHPRRLLQIATLRQKQIEENLPKMVGAYFGEGEKPKIQMFESMDAVRDVYKEAFERLKSGEELCIFTNIGRVIEQFPEVPAAFKKIVGTIVYKSHVRELILGDDAGYEYAQNIRQKLGKGYQLRLSGKNLPFGDNEQFVFKDKIIYFSLQKNIFVVVIENEDLAKTQKAMFEMAWNNALTIEDFEKINKK
jgi:sugar-specific transcriptional regulator TrmB